MQLISFLGPIRRSRKLAEAKERGSSLLEVLVTILIFSFGLMALAGLAAVALQYAKISQLQTVAADLAVEYSERMRANIAGFSANLYDKKSAYSTGKVQAAEACTGDCTSAQMAAKDLAQWLQEVRTRLPGGDAYVLRDTVNPLAVDIWLIWVDPSLSFDGKSTLATTRSTDCPGDAKASTSGARCLYFRVSL